MFEDRRDRGVRQRADLDRPVAGCLYPAGLQPAEQPQDPKAGPEALLGMRPPGHHRDDQRLRGGPDAASVALQTLRRPLGVTPVCARHVFGLGTVPRAAIAPGVRRDALTAVEHLDRALRGGCVDLLADQAVRHSVDKPLHRAGSGRH